MSEVEKHAKQILDTMDVLKDLLDRHEKGGFFDLVPYADRIRNIYVEVANV